MTIVLENFLHSLAKFMASSAGIVYRATTPPEVPAPAKAGLWRDSAKSNEATDPHSVLRIYGGGGTRWEAVPNISIQCDTRGRDPAATLARAQKLLETLLGSEGRPLKMHTIDGYTAAADAADGTWRLIAVEIIGRPGLVGTEENWSIATWNFAVDVVKVS